MQDHNDHIPRDQEIRRILGEQPSGTQDWDQPGNRVWLGIEEVLVGRRRRIAAWWGRFIGALLLLLGLTSAWWLLRESVQAPGNPASDSITQTASSPVGEATAPTPARAADPSGQNAFSETIADPRTSPATGAVERPEGIRPELRPSTQASGTVGSTPASPASPADSPLRAALPGAATLSAPSIISPLENISEDHALLSHDRPMESAISALPQRAYRLEGPEPGLPSTDLTLPIASPSLTKRIHHEFGAYAHGNGVNTALRGRQATFRPTGVLSQEQTAYRMGLHCQWVTSRGWLFGTGLDYQRISENSSREHEIPFTRQGGMPDPQGLAQTFMLAMYGPMGQIRASVPVQVLERMAPLDYQEGETIRLDVDWSQRLDLIRIPLWAGWRQEWRSWFLEGRGGLALSMPLSYRGDVRQVREFRNRIRIREGSTTEKPDGLRDIIPEWQAGLRAGFHLPQGWQVYAGFEYWRSWTSVIRHPEYRSIFQGHGLTLGISKRL